MSRRPPHRKPQRRLSAARLAQAQPAPEVQNLWDQYSQCDPCGNAFSHQFGMFFAI